jgi:hypothetical protein
LTLTIAGEVGELAGVVLAAGLALAAAGELLPVAPVIPPLAAGITYAVAVIEPVSAVDPFVPGSELVLAGDSLTLWIVNSRPLTWRFPASLRVAKWASWLKRCSRSK